MKLSISEICIFADCTPSSRNFVEGEKILNSTHLLSCGKIIEADESYKILAFCLQTSNLKGSPHELRGDISREGKICEITCSCKAGLSQKCKHVVAVLLHCSRNSLDEMEVFSCTDVKSLWSQPQKQSLEKYHAATVKDHECYQKVYKDSDIIKLSDGQESLIKTKLFSIKGNALTKHVEGRHEPLINNNILLNPNYEIIKYIFDNNDSDILKTISGVPLPQLRKCCLARLNNLYNTDLYAVCLLSENSFATWKKERQYRITGSRAYEIYTYYNNNHLDWEKKSIRYFYPQSFSTKCTAYGIQTEEIARNEYEKFTSCKVITCGFVICESNPWLGYSPDGIILKDGKPDKLLEIKCPYEGRVKGIDDIIGKQAYSVAEDNQVILRKKHKYYAQVQVGLAVLNLKSAHFMVYALFNNSFVIIEVQLDIDYIVNLLTNVKKAYFTYMLHYSCIYEQSSEKEDAICHE